MSAPVVYSETSKFTVLCSIKKVKYCKSEMRGKGVEGLKLHAMPCSNFFLFYYYYCLFFACTTTGSGCSDCGKALPCWVSDKQNKNKGPAAGVYNLLQAIITARIGNTEKLSDRTGQQRKLWSQHSKCFTVDKQPLDRRAKEKVKKEFERGSGGSLRVWDASEERTKRAQKGNVSA